VTSRRQDLTRRNKKEGKGGGKGKKEERQGEETRRGRIGRETSGIYDRDPTYVSAHYRPRGIKGAAFTTSHIQPFTASEI